jgi:hypothetical protein
LTRPIGRLERGDGVAYEYTAPVNAGPDDPPILGGARYSDNSDLAVAFNINVLKDVLITKSRRKSKTRKLERALISGARVLIALTSICL